MLDPKMLGISGAVLPRYSRDEKQFELDFPTVYADFCRIDKTIDYKKRLMLYKAGLYDFPKCVTCGKPTSGPKRRACSVKCSAADPQTLENRTKTCMERFGVPNGGGSAQAIAKMNAHSMTKYGTMFPVQSKELEQRRKEIVREKFGGDSPFASKHVQDKAKETLTEKYGVDNILRLEEYRNRDKAKETCLERYGSEYANQRNLKNLDDVHNRPFVEDLITQGWQACAEHFGYTTETHSAVTRFLRDNGYTFERSCPELEVATYVESLGFGIIRSDRTLCKPREIDIYIPSRKLAIEFDGVYWHSSGSRDTDKEKSMYHLRKTEECEAQGIQLLHIFGNEWDDPQMKSIWKSVIASKLGVSTRKIPARKCVVEEIIPSIANKFCQENHLQGFARGASLNLGLYFGDELVMVATLGKSRYTKTDKLELLRLCSLKDTNVQGGASKLLKGLSYVSYANRRWSCGSVYEKNGLQKISVSTPGYYYVKSGKLEHRSGFMKHLLAEKLEKFDSSLTEVENCYRNGYRRIWDCGHILYETL